MAMPAPLRLRLLRRWLALAGQAGGGSGSSGSNGRICFHIGAHIHAGIVGLVGTTCSISIGRRRRRAGTCCARLGRGS